MVRKNMNLLGMLLVAAGIFVMAWGFVGCSTDEPELLNAQTVNPLNPNKDLDPLAPERPVIEAGVSMPQVIGTPSVMSVVDLAGGLTPLDLAEALIGSGPNAPIISNVTYTGANVSAGTFTGGSTVFGFETGVVLGSGDVKLVPGPNVSDGATYNAGLPGDADLEGLIPGYTTNDACVLEFDFECPVLNVISFEYVFSSDEYNEYVNTSFNDVFGFFVNGQNIALLPDMVTTVSINNVNCNNPYGPPTGSNCDLYINNDLSDGGGMIDTEMDGFTVVLTATITVDPGVNHIKLAIADAGDHILDSNVLIKGESFLCAPPAPDAYFDAHPTSCPNPLNIKSGGVFPAALLGGSDLGYDASEIDPSTLLLNGMIAPVKWALEDVAAPLIGGEECECNTDGPDGYMDLAFKFKTQEIVAILGPVYWGDTKVLTITGALYDGTPFEATDCIKIVGAPIRVELMNE